MLLPPLLVLMQRRRPWRCVRVDLRILLPILLAQAQPIKHLGRQGRNKFVQEEKVDRGTGSSRERGRRRDGAANGAQIQLSFLPSPSARLTVPLRASSSPPGLFDVDGVAIDWHCRQ